MILEREREKRSERDRDRKSSESLLPLLLSTASKSPSYPFTSPLLKGHPPPVEQHWAKDILLSLRGLELFSGLRPLHLTRFHTSGLLQSPLEIQSSCLFSIIPNNLWLAIYKCIMCLQFDQVMGAFLCITRKVGFPNISPPMNQFNL